MTDFERHSAQYCEDMAQKYLEARVDGVYPYIARGQAWATLALSKRTMEATTTAWQASMLQAAPAPSTGPK